MTPSARTTPLPSPSEADAYVPLSWAAVAALASALGLLLLLVVLAADAFWRKIPLLELDLVLLGVGTVLVLSFIARRRVRDSEGTLAGQVQLGRQRIDLSNTAWWTAVVVAITYLAYWLAITIPLQREAVTQAARLVEHLNQGNLAAAFHQLLPPGSGVAPGDLPTMEARYRKDFLHFRKSSLVQTTFRNPGQCRFIPGSIHNVEFSTGQMTCIATGTLESPEGRLHLSFPLKAVSLARMDPSANASGRLWQVLPDTNGYVNSTEYTPYGWAIHEVINKGVDHAYAFLRRQSGGLLERREAYVIYALRASVDEDSDRAALAAVLGPGVWFHYPATWLDQTSDRLFTRANGVVPTDRQREQFRRMWRTIGLMPSGSRLKDYQDSATPLSITSERLELAVAVEIPLPGAKGEPGAAVGRLILQCDDRAVLERLRTLREHADPAQTTPQPPTDLNLPPIPWRVQRVESELQFIEMSR